MLRTLWPEPSRYLHSVAYHTFLIRFKIMACLLFFFFFFQAEDGIRDVAVTGVQTCALPISAAQADDLKIALIYGKTGPLEAYAKQTETGLRLGFEYATKGTNMIDGRKIVIIDRKSVV